MDQELQKYYDSRFEMMSLKGWEDLMEEVTAFKEQIESIKNIKTQEDLWFQKGQLDMCDWLLGLKIASELAFDELTKNG
jgi:hypothetical protein